MIKFTPKTVTENLNIVKTSPLKQCFILLAGLLAIIFVFYFLLGLSVSWIAPHISPAFEKKIGRLFEDRFYQNENMDESKRLRAILNNLLKGVDEETKAFGIEVRVENNPMINAVALPGGTIVVFSGLLKEIKSDNEAAFVLAHEIGHFKNRDHLKGLGRGLVLLTASVFLTGNDSIATNFIFSQIGNLEMKFSRKQEKEADLFALHLIYDMTGQADGAASFMKVIASQDKRSNLSYYFASHPHPETRMEYINEEIAGLR
ncbi:MAG: M48 family metallopeptidase [Desulfobacterales bacterium]|nr:M48 family metallopeptidase [Desulfobacterales bacterium]